MNNLKYRWWCKGRETSIPYEKDKVGLHISEQNRQVMGKENESYLGTGEVGFFITIGQWSISALNNSKMRTLIKNNQIWAMDFFSSLIKIAWNNWIISGETSY